MIPNNTLSLELQGDIDYENDTFEALLLKDTTAFTPDASTHETVADVLNDGDEYDDDGYDRVTVDGKSLSVNDSENRVEWDANDLEWVDIGSDVGQTIQACVVYRLVNDDTDSEVIRVIDDDNSDQFPKNTNGSNFKVEWDATGIRTTSA